jgi:hypothetical protein
MWHISCKKLVLTKEISIKQKKILGIIGEVCLSKKAICKSQFQLFVVQKTGKLQINKE